MQPVSHYAPPKSGPDYRLVAMQAEIMRLNRRMGPTDRVHLTALRKARKRYPVQPTERGKLRAWRKACAEIDRNCGVPEAKARERAASKAWSNAINRLIRTPAKTTPGALYKLRLAFALEPNLDCDDYPLMEEGMVERVLDDLARIVKRETRP